MVIEVALRILRRHWANALVLALLFVGPGALLTAASGTRFNSVALDVFPGVSEGTLDDAATLTAGQLERLVGALIAYLGATIVAGVLGSIGALGFSTIVDADYHGRPSDLGEALRTALRKAPSALAFILLTTLIIIGIAITALVAMLGVLTLFSTGSLQQGGPGVFISLIIVVALVVGVVYLSLRWAMAYPVMAVEDARWRAALTRTWHLSGDNLGRILFVLAFGTILTLFASALIAQLLALVLVDVVAASVGLDPTIAETVVIAIGAVLLAPVLPILTAVLYFDLRVRRDDEAPAAAAEEGS